LRRSHQKKLVGVPVYIADYCAAIGKASILQPRKTEVCSNDDSRLRTEDVGQDLQDGREQACQKALRCSRLAPKSYDEKN
jgi:hypothetical protein